jgi:hypothetical protein
MSNDKHEIKIQKRKANAGLTQMEEVACTIKAFDDWPL